MITIDGSEGEGGGQILRTALSLSVLTGKPFTIKSIRARRAKPGLMRQHPTAVKAAAEISGAQVEGADVGATSLVFAPGPAKPGDYVCRIGSAGSTTLVLQTVLAPLALAGGRSPIVIEGGTHNQGGAAFRVHRTLLSAAAPAHWLRRLSGAQRAGLLPVWRRQHRDFHRSRRGFSAIEPGRTWAANIA